LRTWRAEAAIATTRSDATRLIAESIDRPPGRLLRCGLAENLRIPVTTGRCASTAHDAFA
jgi:hypothetical protein